jgi:predicted metalloprotease with PDZ domain
MRQAYRTTYKTGRGFNGTDWWAAVRAAAGKAFPDFNDRFIDGRDPFPWDSVLPLAGLRMAVDSIRVPRLGIESRADSTGIRIVNIQPEGPAAAAGVQVGDELLELGGIAMTSQAAFDEFRTRFADKEGDELPITVRRNGHSVTLKATVKLATVVDRSLAFDPNASALAVRIRNGILTGSTTP